MKIKALSLLLFTSILMTACSSPFSGDQSTDETADSENTETRMIVTITNISSEPLSPGVFITHDKANPFFIEGTETSAAWEALAEKGETSMLESEMNAHEAVYTVFSMPVGLNPGETYSFQDESAGDYISGAMMPIRSNDGLSMVLKADFGPGAYAESMTYDNGTEENGALDSEEDDTASDPQEKVSVHDQFGEPLYSLEIKARDY